MKKNLGTHHLKSSYPIFFSPMGIPKKDNDARLRGDIFAYRSNTSWTINNGGKETALYPIDHSKKN